MLIDLSDKIFDCEITRGVIETEKSKLKGIDKNFVLKYRLDYLANIFGIVKSLGVNLESAVFFEFGASHHNVSLDTERFPYDPSVSHFFALYHKKLGIEYFAFDSKYSLAKLVENLEKWKKFQTGIRNKEDIDAYTRYFRKIDINVIDELLQRIPQISIDKFEDIPSRIDGILKMGNTPILFSNHVLSTPDFNGNFDFWHLPGLHLHTSYFRELCKKHDINYEEEIEKFIRLKRLGVIEFERKGNRISSSEQDFAYEFRRLLTAEYQVPKNPKKHLDLFKQIFKLPKEVPINYLLYEPRNVITHYWVNC